MLGVEVVIKVGFQLLFLLGSGWWRKNYMNGILNLIEVEVGVELGKKENFRGKKEAECEETP